MGTFIVAAILLGIVALISRNIYKSKKAGKHPACGDSCKDCGHGCGCH